MSRVRDALKRLDNNLPRERAVLVGTSARGHAPLPVQAGPGSGQPKYQPVVPQPRLLDDSEFEEIRALPPVRREPEKPSVLSQVIDLFSQWISRVFRPAGRSEDAVSVPAASGDAETFGFAADPPGDDDARIEESVEPMAQESQGLEEVAPQSASGISPGFPVPRCSGLTRAGSPCRAPAMANGLCRMHGGSRQRRVSFHNRGSSSFARGPIASSR